MPDGAVSIQLSDAEHTPAGSPLTLGRDQTLSGKQVDVWHGLDVRPIRRTESWLGSVLGELRDLLSLAAGWDSYGAAAIDADLAPLVNSVLGWLAREQQPRPSLVPTSAGGIQLEWYSRELELELEITPGGYTITLFYRDRRTGTTWEGLLGDEPEPFDRLLARVARSA